MGARGETRKGDFDCTGYYSISCHYVAGKAGGMKTFIIIAVLLVILRDIIAYLLGWGNGESFADLLDDARHNRAIDREWKRNGKPIVEKTVGWRPDPINKNDGFRNDRYDGLNRAGDEQTYSKLIRGGTKEYRERFAKDVERSKK